jgi:hypothetical protein
LAVTEGPWRSRNSHFYQPGSDSKHEYFDQYLFTHSQIPRRLLDDAMVLTPLVQTLKGIITGGTAEAPLHAEVHGRQGHGNKKQQVGDLHQVQHRRVVVPVSHHDAPVPEHETPEGGRDQRQAPEFPDQLPPVLLSA